MKHISTILFSLWALLWLHAGRAQQLQWSWAVQGEGAGGEHAAGMVCDSLGNVYITGHFTDSVRFDEIRLTAQGGQDIFLAKYDKEGKILWAKSVGGSGSDYAGALNISPGGQLYLAGAVGKEALFDGQRAGEKKQNLFVARYSNEGELQWVKAWPSRPGDYITAITSDSTGNVHLGGYFEKKMNIDAQHGLSAKGKTDAFAACFNSEGQVQWVRSWGGKGHDKITHLTVRNHQLWMTGICQLSLPAGPQTIAVDGAEPAAFVLRCTVGGELLHARKLAEGNNIYIASIKPLANGTVAVGGSFSDSLKTAQQTLRSYGNHDIFIAVTDTTGMIQWVRQTGSYGFDKLYDIMELPSSGMMATGIYSGTLFFGSDTTSFHSRHADLFALSMNYEGERQWVSVTKGRTEQYPAALAQDTKGNVYVAGAFRDTLKFRRSILTAAKGHYSVFFAKLHPCAEHRITFLCDTVFTEGSLLPIKLEGSYAAYRWDRGRSTAPEYQVSCGGVYRVLVTDSLNCVYRDSIRVRQTPAVPVLQIRAQADPYRQVRDLSCNSRHFALFVREEEMDDC